MIRGEKRGLRILRFFLFGMLLLACLACGRKAPPVPPRFDGLTPPSGVSASMEGEVLTLSWAEPPFSERSLVTGYRIYLSMLKKGEERCAGCPVRFEKIGERGSHGRGFGFSAPEGVLYILEVRSEAAGGYLSDPSRRVEVDRRGSAMPDQ